MSNLISLLSHEKGEGYPAFDPAQAKEHFTKVNKRSAALIKDAII